ncbi:MAG: fatty acid desaturase [Planctomycetota bacterium]
MADTAARKASPAASTERQAASPAASGFSLAQARSIVGESFRPKPWVYWTDLLASWAVAMVAFQLVTAPVLGDSAADWAIRVGCFLVSSLLIYRCSLFIHELMHLPEDKMVVFRKAWNLICGVPFLIPSFIYLTHIHHHRRKHYGTEHDGEYLPLSSRSPWYLVWYLSQSLFIPVLAVVRFGVLTPLTWFNTPLRQWVLRHASSMIIDPAYLRPLPTEKTLRLIRRQERFVFAYLVIFGVLIYRGAFHNGLVNPWVLLQAYLTGVTIVTINALRTVGAHRWLNADESEMTFVEQLVDSVNYDRGWLAELWAPVGLRYHALHHLFPSMPYHALPTAHARLMAGLPADSPYRQTVGKSLTAELADLWRRAAESQHSSEKAPRGKRSQLAAP